MTSQHRSRTHRHAPSLIVALVSLFGSSVALADKPQLAITALPDDEIEIRVDDQYSYMPARDVATPPIPVLEVDELNFLKIKAKDGRVVWVNKAEVETSDLAKLRKNCQSIAMAKPDDSVALGVRGVGEKCGH